MTQMDNEKKSGMKKFGEAVAKKNGVFTWIAIGAILIAVGATWMKH